MVLQLLQSGPKGWFSHSVFAFWLVFFYSKCHQLQGSKKNHPSEAELQLLGHWHNKFIFHFHNTTLICLSSWWFRMNLCFTSPAIIWRCLCIPFALGNTMCVATSSKANLSVTGIWWASNWKDLLMTPQKNGPGWRRQDLCHINKAVCQFQPISCTIKRVETYLHIPHPDTIYFGRTWLLSLFNHFRPKQQLNWPYFLEAE